jgi:diaminopimelate epimerase
VDMGPAIVGEPSTASVDGAFFPGMAVDVGNPHLACVTGHEIAALDLTAAPGYDRALFPHGVNVEFVSPFVATGGSSDGEVTMRVHERGVGETRSCGTGTVAVHTLGGRLRVTVDAATTMLHGPAVLVAHGELTRSWWEAAGREPARMSS